MKVACMLGIGFIAMILFWCGFLLLGESVNVHNIIYGGFR